MARFVYGGGGDTALVDTGGNILAGVSAAVYSTRVGGSIVTDITDMDGSPLAGTVTSDAYGQIVFQGPNGYTATLWLQFTGQPIRWAVRPTNTDLAIVEELATGPAVKNAALSTTSTSTPTAVTQAVTSQTSALHEFKDALGVIGTSINPAGGMFIWSTNPASVPHTVQGAVLQAWNLQEFKNSSGSVLSAFDAAGRLVGQGVPHLLARQQLASNASSIVISGIPQTWRDLRLVMRLRGTAASNETAAYVQMNGVTSGYDASLTQDFNGYTGGGVSSPGYYLTGLVGFHGGFAPAASASSGAFSAGEILIPEYSDTAKRKQAVGSGGYTDGTRHYEMTALSGNAATAAIGSLTIVPGSGSWASGSVVSLYVMGA